MIDPDKYVTVKREDWEAALEGTGLDPNWSSEIILPDARVIRDQDIFAASAYYAYANHIRGTIEVMQTVGVSVPSTFGLLQEIADYFMNAAEVAEANPNRKLPI